MNFFCLRIGELHIRFAYPSPAWRSFLRREYGPFISRSPAGRPVEVAIRESAVPRVHGLSVDHTRDGTEIRRSDFRSTSTRNLSQTELSIKKDKYAFDSWLRVFVTCLGIRNGALLIHGAGYFHGGRTFLFPGRSGRGKSTMIRILGKPGALSDELTLLYVKGGSVRCASTPFWGELSRGTGRTSTGPLHGIYFLRHGKKEALKPLALRDAVRELLKTVLFFDPSAHSAQKMLDLVTSAAARVPSFTLTFAKESPRPRLLEMVKNT